MTTLTEKRNAAGDRYAAAVVQLRAAFADFIRPGSPLPGAELWSGARDRSAATSDFCSRHRREFNGRNCGRYRGIRGSVNRIGVSKSNQDRHHNRLHAGAVMLVHGLSPWHWAPSKMPCLNFPGRPKKAEQSDYDGK